MSAKWWRSTLARVLFAMAHTATAGTFDAKLLLHGSGDVPGTGEDNTSYWDDTSVRTEGSTPVPDTSWGAIKGMFRWAGP